MKINWKKLNPSKTLAAFKLNKRTAFRFQKHRSQRSGMRCRSISYSTKIWRLNILLWRDAGAFLPPLAEMTFFKSFYIIAYYLALAGWNFFNHSSMQNSFSCQMTLGRRVFKQQFLYQILFELWALRTFNHLTVLPFELFQGGLKVNYCLVEMSLSDSLFRQVASYYIPIILVMMQNL